MPVRAVIPQKNSGGTNAADNSHGTGSVAYVTSNSNPAHMRNQTTIGPAITAANLA